MVGISSEAMAARRVEAYSISHEVSIGGLYPYSQIIGVWRWLVEKFNEPFNLASNQQQWSSVIFWGGIIFGWCTTLIHIISRESWLVFILKNICGCVAVIEAFCYVNIYDKLWTFGKVLTKNFGWMVLAYLRKYQIR